MTPLGSISGNVSEDTDNDDIGEEPLSGVTIMLLDSSGGMVSATETDALGNYVFYDLPMGDYQVKETDPSTLVSVSDIDNNGDVNLIDVTLSPTTTFNSTGNDFVDELTAGVSGIILEDTDEDT